LAVIAGGRSKSLLFALGVVLAQGLACALVAFIDLSFVRGDEHDHLRFRGLLEVGFGIALFGLAANVRHRPVQSAEATTRRFRTLLERVRRMRATTALLAGLLLGIGGPKRLVLTALAGTSIAVSEVSNSQALALVAAYTAVATLLVWLPVVAFAMAGDRVLGKLRAAQAALVRHESPLAFSSLLLIGTFAVVDGAAKLL
jgi:hypothetical protein